MPGFVQPLPALKVWKQDDRTHPDFYWLAVPANQAKAGQEVVASFTGNSITLEKNDHDTLLIRLSDAMMDLNKPVKLYYEGKCVFSGKVARTLLTLQRTIASRFDAGLVFPAELTVRKKGGKLMVTATN